MTHTVLRQNVIDAIEAETKTWKAWPQAGAAKRKIIAAIKEIPAVTVTDEMVEQGAMALLANQEPSISWDELTDFDQKAYKVEARAALIAALGEHI